MAQECGVSRRTIFRDLDVLREAGVQLTYDDDHRAHHIPGPDLLPPTNFTADEALALLVLCQELGDHAGVPFLHAAQHAAVKLENCLPRRLRDYLQSMSGTLNIKAPPRNPLVGREAVFDVLLRAAAARRCVRIEYQSLAEDRAIRTRLSPYRLFFSRRSWYAVGRSSLHRGVRTFNVGRFTAAELLDDTFQVPRGFSLDRHLRNAWHLIAEPGPDQDVVVRFSKLVAKNVAEVLWHKTQGLTFHDDGSLDFRVRVSGLNEISWWIMGYGDQAEVLQPPALRQIIARRVASLVARYGTEEDGTAP